LILKVQSTVNESQTTKAGNQTIHSQNPQELHQHQSCNSSGDKPSDLKSLPSYQSVLELGYAPRLIENAVQILSRNGKKINAIVSLRNLYRNTHVSIKALQTNLLFTCISFKLLNSSLTRAI